MANILVAEDDTPMRHFLSGALERAGHGVAVSGDGLEALAMLEKDGAAFDLLLTDVVMPGLDGLELAKRARAARPAMKIMFITGFTGLLEAAGAEEEIEKSPVIAKPFHLKDLVDQVQAILDMGS